MEIAIHGEGQVVVRFIDATGRTLLEERLSVSGSPAVQARRVVPLALQTVEGNVPLAPVLVRRSDTHQRVSFDGQAPMVFTRKRCREIKCSPKIAAKAARGVAPEVQREAQAGLLSEGPDIRSLLDAKR